MGKDKIKSSERKRRKRNIKQYKMQGFASEEWFSYNYWFIDRQRKLITKLRDKGHCFPELSFPELDNLTIEDQTTFQWSHSDEPEQRWKDILSLMLYYLDRMDEQSWYNTNPFEDQFYAAFIEESLVIEDEKAKENLRKSWETRNENIRKDIEKYKGRFFRLLSKYFFYMSD